MKEREMRILLTLVILWSISQKWKLTCSFQQKFKKFLISVLVYDTPQNLKAVAIFARTCCPH